MDKPRWDGRKSATEEHYAIDVRPWQRGGFLEAGRSFSTQWLKGREQQVALKASIFCTGEALLLIYRLPGQGCEQKPIEAAISLTTTPCHFGGQRYWYICPNMGCGRRVAKLYLVHRYFLCRHCQQLTYRCQQENVLLRAHRRRCKTKEKLGWNTAFGSSPGTRPKWMRSEKFYALYGQTIRDGDLILEGMRAATRRMLRSTITVGLA